MDKKTTCVTDDKGHPLHRELQSFFKNFNRWKSSYQGMHLWKTQAPQTVINGIPCAAIPHDVLDTCKRLDEKHHNAALNAFLKILEFKNEEMQFNNINPELKAEISEALYKVQQIVEVAGDEKRSTGCSCPK